MHHPKLPLTACFWAGYLMATHSNGISALQLQRQPAFGSYKTGWLLCAKLLPRSMLAPIARWPASSRSMRLKSPAAAKTIRSPVAADAVIRAKCWWSEP
jgi:hypothetical protein